MFLERRENMSSRTKFTTVQEYIGMQPEKTKTKLFELKQCILKAAPDAGELINYNILAYSLTPGGKRDQQVMIAGYKNHVGLYPGADTMEHFTEKLKQYKQGRGSVQFPINEPLPEELIIEMVKYKRQQIIDALKSNV